MIDSLPDRPLHMPEVEHLDESSDSIHVSAVSILTPEGKGYGSSFEVYTLLMETGDTRHLVGFDEDVEGWAKFWEGGVDETYEEASEAWMRERYADRITDEQRIDARDDEQ